MSAPYVSGVAALMLSQNPDLMHLQVKKIIMDTSVSNASLQGYIGKGKVEPDDAYTVASNTQPDGDIPPWTPTSVGGSIGLTSAASVMGCASLSDIYKDNDDSGFNAGSGVSLFFLSWPFLFILLLRFFLLQIFRGPAFKRKFLFYKF